MGSSLRSNSNKIGGVSVFRKSNSCSSCVMLYRTSVASFLHSRLFFSWRINGFFFSDSKRATTPSVVRDKLSWFQSSGEDEKSLAGRRMEQRSGLITRKSAKYSITPLTTSWSSASASRSRALFFTMLLKSVSVRKPASIKEVSLPAATYRCGILHTWAPVARQSGIECCLKMDGGRPDIGGVASFLFLGCQGDR